MAHGEKICACCGAGDGIEEHHLYLKSEGCPDDLTIYLCHTCHGRAHRMKRRVDVKTATTAKLQSKKARGEVYTRNVLGYEAVGQRMVPVAAEQAVIAEIRTMRGQGMSMGAIAQQLNAKGVRGKRGGRFGAETISKILSNPIQQVG